MAEFTKGEWKYAPESDEYQGKEYHDCYRGTIHGGELNMALCVIIKDCIDPNVAEANGRLIASAPVLYEALKEVKNTLRAGFSHNPEIDSAEIAVEYLHGLWEHCQKVIDQALALVEGK